jgi:transketolase
MRLVVRDSLIDLFERRPFVFLTGDVGFGVLEPLREAMGERFINAGVAEQNMVSVAAGLAQGGEDAWVYSIAPFVFARPFEQIRNDVCLHDLPVKILGNGGGYAYGVMGATHHAIEDYGVLLGLQNMHVFVPAFAADVPAVIDKLSGFEHPAYLRLGRCERPEGYEPPPYEAWRCLREGDGPVVLVVGPIVGSLIGAALDQTNGAAPEIWCVSELPLPEELPSAFAAALERSGRLIVVEEHVKQGSVGRALAEHILRTGVRLERFEHVAAAGYPSGTYGSQGHHRDESGLGTANLLAKITDIAS